MTSVPPNDVPEPLSPHNDTFQSDVGDEDTGPLDIPATPHEVEDGWGRDAEQRTPVAGSAWTDRFEAPLTVTPRTLPTRATPDPRYLLGVLGAVVAVLLVGALVFWLTRPSERHAEPSAQPPPATTATPPASEDNARLTRLLPRGYPADACTAVEAPKDGLAQMNCGPNTDQDGPLTGTYTLQPDRAALDAAFKDAIGTAQQVNCPGNIQSPGPWRRNATPQTVSGTLFCGLREGQPTVVWTDDAKLVLNVVQSGPQGPTLPALYSWWSSHS